MELTGDLSDFALADILQIMALSRKTGTVLLESGEHKGRILLQQGKITHASTSSFESLAERIIRTRGISEEIIQELMNIGSRSEGVWGLDTLIAESGILGERDIKADARNHIRSVLGNLLGFHKGRFNIVLNNAVIPEPYKQVVLPNGLDVSEVLLEAARYSDELKRYENSSEDLSKLEFEDSVYSPSDNDIPQSNVETGSLKAHYSDRLARFCSLLGELNANTSESEITLMLMRYASELVSRGILFSVGKGELFGLGQFGLGLLSANNNGNSDVLIRNLRIPLSSNCLLSSIVRTSRPTIEKMHNSHLDEQILRTIGGIDRNLTVLAVPLVCEGRVTFILYGDNFPDENPIEGIEELFVFAHLASLVLEKIKLEERMGLFKDQSRVAKSQVS